MIVLGLDIAITLAGIVVNRLELASAPTVFLVVSAGGLQFVAVALATSLATRVVLAQR